MVINIGTEFKLADNSGVKKLKNINILNKNKKFNSGNISVSVVKKGFSEKRKVKKSSMVCAVIACTKRYNFSLYRGVLFNNNSAILLDSRLNMCVTKVKGILPITLKNKIKLKRINTKKALFI